MEKTIQSYRDTSSMTGMHFKVSSDGRVQGLGVISHGAGFRISV